MKSHDTSPPTSLQESSRGISLQEMKGNATCLLYAKSPLVFSFSGSISAELVRVCVGLGHAGLGFLPLVLRVQGLRCRIQG